MMLIEKIRSRTQGLLAKVIVGLIVIAFALFGFGSITTFLVSVPKVAEVNGEEVTEQEMLMALERSRRALLADGQTQPQDIDEDELRRSVLESLIERKLLEQAVAELGFFVSDVQLDADIVNTPSFQVDGQFNADRFQLVLGSAGFTPLTYRETIREESKFQQLSFGIADSEFITDDEAEVIGDLSRQVRDVAYLRIPVADLQGTIVVDEAEIEDYYNANRDDFYTEEQVSLAYVEVSKPELAELVEVSEDELRGFYEQEKGNYTEPETRRASHILIEINGDVAEATALEQITSAQQRVLAGEDFAAVAKDLSQDPGTAANGGDLGFSQRGAFVDAFEEALYSMEVNQVSEPVLTEYGYHLIKLLEVRPERVPDFAELSERLERDFRNMKAEEEFVLLSARLAELAYEMPDLISVAEELDLKVRETGMVGRSATAGIAANPRVMELAFSPDLLLDGLNSDVVEIDAEHHLVFRVREHQRSELQALDEVHDIARARLLEQRARALAETRAEEALKLLRDGSLTRFVADQVGGKWIVEETVARQDPRLEQPITDAAFRLPRPAEGDKSVGSVTLANGDAVVISVSRIGIDDSREISPGERDALAQFMSTNKGAAIFAEYRRGLSSQATIEKL